MLETNWHVLMVKNQSSTLLLRESFSNRMHVSTPVGCRHGYRLGHFFFLSWLTSLHWALCFSWTSAYPPFTNITPFLFTWFFLLLSGNIASPPHLPDRCHPRCRPHRADCLSMKSRQALWVKWKQLLAVARQLQIWLIPQPRPSSTDTPPPPNPQNNPYLMESLVLQTCSLCIAPHSRI